MKQDMRERTGFTWLRTGSNSRLLWTRQWTTGLHKRLGISWPDKRLLHSQAGACSTVDRTLTYKDKWWENSSKGITTVSTFTGTLQKHTLRRCIFHIDDSVNHLKIQGRRRQCGYPISLHTTVQVGL
jgi:hypothetical protein